MIIGDQVIARSDRTSLLAAMALLAVAAVWGSTFVMVDRAMTVGPPLLFLSVRFSVASAAMIVVFRKRAVGRAAWRAGAVVGGALFAGFATQTAGLVYTSAAKSAFITSTYVVLVPLIVWGLTKRPPRRPEVLASALAVIGLWLLLVPEGAWAAPNRGDILTVACAAAFALHIVLLGRASTDTSVASLATAQIVVCAGLSAVGSLLFEGPPDVPTEAGFLAAAVFTGLFATAAAFVVQTAGQRHLDASRTAVLLATEPMFAVLFALWLGESFGLRQGLGGLAITAASLAAVMSRRWEPRAK
jgi:drug/metabolite transporter (DMT)-like permease